MVNSVRWTTDQLDEYRKRAEERGGVKTHTISDRSPVSKEKRGGGRKRKYGNIKAEADGMIFASRRERGRWMDLRLEEKAGAIKDLKRQVVYPLAVNGITVCDYIADFVYERSGALVVEDAKGYQTNVYRIKKKLMLAVHGVEVVES